MRDTDIWAMFYAAVVGMELHPGNRQNHDQQKINTTLRGCAGIADRMLTIYMQRKATWLSPYQPSSPPEPQPPETTCPPRDSKKPTPATPL